jgi:hypothetical protein
MKKEKAQIIKKVKDTAGKFHAWYEAYLPKEKITILIRKPYAQK